MSAMKTPVRAFLALAMAMNFCLSTISITLCTASVRATRQSGEARALMGYERTADALRLVLMGLLSNVGYRQYLVFWQLRGLHDFLKGKKGWDKFGRKGFALPAAPAVQGR